jgi:CRISPR-associated endoribonuclease Cas6
MESPLSHFKLAQFQFFLKPIDFIHLPPYKGSTLRGGFGHAFKKVVCINRDKNCISCLLKNKCVYSYIFETPPPPDTSKMRKYPFAPHPFIITPPLEEKREYREGETICFRLTLIGKSIDYLPYFIYTFDELGLMGIGKGKGKYQLEEVIAITPGGRSKVEGERGNEQGEWRKVKGEEAIPIYSGKDKILHSNYKIMQIEDLLTFDLTPFTLDLIFVTPTRLKFDGKLSPTLEFHILIRNLLRRVSLLSYFHCDRELNLDFKGIIEKSREIKVGKSNLHWFDWERYSNRQDTKMMLGGFIGSVTFEGNFEQFLQYLLLGEYIHVGKGTSFGLGKYEILNLEF